MLYWATSGFAVGVTVVTGGVELPAPQPSDKRVNRMTAEEHSAPREIVTRASKPGEKDRVGHCS